MLVAKILKKDFLRKKSITIVVFAFMFLSAWLVAGGSNLIVELSNALNGLFATAHVPVVCHLRGWLDGTHRSARRDEHRARAWTTGAALSPAARSLPQRWREPECDVRAVGTGGAAAVS